MQRVRSIDVIRTVYRLKTNGLYIGNRWSIYGKQTICFFIIRVVYIYVLRYQLA